MFKKIIVERWYYVRFVGNIDDDMVGLMNVIYEVWFDWVVL